MLRNNMTLIIVICVLTLLGIIKEILINKYCSIIGVCIMKKPNPNLPLSTCHDMALAISIIINSIAEYFIMSFFISFIKHLLIVPIKLNTF